MTLLGSMWYTAIAAIAAFTILSIGAAGARIAQIARAQTFVPATLHRAEASLLQTVAAQMQATGSVSPAPSVSPLPSQCANASCSMSTGATIALTQTSALQNGASCDTSQTNCAQDIQTNGYVAENRITARITATISTAGGSVLVARSENVSVRTTQTPPYATLAGNKGDDGGMAPATPNPCSTAAAGTSADTEVRVQYNNQATSACSDAGTFSNASFSTTSGAPPGWP